MALLLLLGSGAGCHTEARPRGAILILLDAARPDRFSVYGYPRTTTPNMDRLARRGVLFRNHYAQATQTLHALPSLLRSRYYARQLLPSTDRSPFAPVEDLFRGPDSESVSLPKALSAAGFRTAMISAHAWLRPNTTFASEFDEVYALTTILPPDPEHKHPRAEHVVDFAIRWLESNGDRDFFLYLHLMDTHFPHRFEEDAQQFLDPETYRQVNLDTFHPTGFPKDIRAELSHPDREYLNALYDGSLLYADRHLGRLLDHLGGAVNEVVIAITSDHGESLLEQPGRFGHGGPWFETVARVPLILSHPPSLEPRVSDLLTEAIDVAPTLLDLLGVGIPRGKRFDGTALGPMLRGEVPEKRHVFMRRAVRGRRFKCVFAANDEVLLLGRAPMVTTLRGMLFDLAADPSETVNLWGRRPARIRDCLARYRERLTEPFLRHRAATTTEPPRSSFAIMVSDFGIVDGVRSARVAEVGRHLSSGKGWLVFSDGPRRYLLATRETEPLEIELRLPNGRYEVTATLRGSGTFQLGPEARLRGRPVNSSAVLQMLRTRSPEREFWDHVQVGAVEIRDERFQLTINPDTEESPFVIQYLGFNPVVPGEEEAPDRAEQERLFLERLRELGYVD